MIAKGTSTSEITNTTVTSEMPNQMIAGKVQPTPEKEFKKRRDAVLNGRAEQAHVMGQGKRRAADHKGNAHRRNDVRKGVQHVADFVDVGKHRQ